MAKQLPRNGSRPASFAIEPSHAGKAQRGRTSIEDTPLTILTSGVEIPDELAALVRSKLGEKLGKFALQIERVSARFVDVNGPKGGVDTECRIKVALHPLPSLVVSGRGLDARSAFNSASTLTVRAVQRSLARAGFSEGRARKRKPKESSATAKEASAPPSTGIRKNRGAANVHTASRNARKHAPKATAMLENSATGKPSRKSSRKSANRVKAAQNLERVTHDTAMGPQSRAAAAEVHRR